MAVTSASVRRDLTPASALPLSYFAGAHAGLLLACAILVVKPDLPGGFFLHARMVAVVHLVTLAWITGSILGALYIVAPLALRVPLPVGVGDWLACVAFWSGVAGMVASFWMAEYAWMAHAACLVVVPVAWIGWRVCRALPRASAPWPVSLHVGLAFVNVLVAAGLGIVIGIGRSHGWRLGSPLAMAYAHAHLAAVGWAVMMAVGLAYRLIPMILPAQMPTGRRLATSAVLLELGIGVLAAAWLVDATAWLPIGALLVCGGLAAFAHAIRQTVKHRLPRPPALPSRDWSTWQAHAALMWLMLAMGLGLVLSVISPGRLAIVMGWVYGVAALVGFLGQFIVGMAGRIVPLYAWYRAMDARGGRPPERAANALPNAAFARAIFLAWTASLPVLTFGLASGRRLPIQLGAAGVAAGVILGAAYIRHILRDAKAT